ncbi:uncharacterized protein LOC121871365 [Homarus americanus]|uniref:Uncharacterized protein n=1 Tax=Homarus americanus TaxID=6706 RepID=A0A8J5TKY7_HOMAM|nr:uncharacterized protein LOC121871365 [Homarus americanus]KAG7177271.1 hypothetical protein Hamer_G000554 [Homarus americanus]
MKVKARKYIDSERRSHVKTGGGPPDFQPASQAVEDILAVLPPKTYQPIDTDIGDDEPLPLDQAGKTFGIIQDDAVIIHNYEIVEDDMGEILNGRKGTSSNLFNSRPHSSLGTENEVSRPYSGCSNRHETFRHQYQTPKKVAAKNVEKSCELDVQLLHSKLRTEKLALEYYDLKREKQKELLFQEE